MVKAAKEAAGSTEMVMPPSGDLPNLEETQPSYTGSMFG